jgi:hypothetical protein
MNILPRRRPLLGALSAVGLSGLLIHCSQPATPDTSLGSKFEPTGGSAGSGVMSSGGMTVGTGGSGGSGGTAAGGGTGGTIIVEMPDGGGTGPVPSEGDACADVEFATTKIVPTVVLLIDRSASMSEEDLDAANPGVTRWDALKTGLLDPAGAIASLQDQVRLGVVFYAGGARGGACPVLDQGGEPPVLMPPRTGLLPDLTTYFQPLDTLPDTPTGESVAATAAELAAFTEPGPKFIVLATDGEPDLCDDRQEPSGRDQSLAEVTAAYAAGITTFVISVGADVAEEHLAEIANAGQGFPPTDMPATPRFVLVTTQQALVDAFAQVINGARSCTLTLNGEIDPDLSDKGEVLLDGMPVPMSDTNGGRIVDGSTLELVGAACDAIQSGDHTLSASFPCEAIIKPPR